MPPMYVISEEEYEVGKKCTTRKPQDEETVKCQRQGLVMAGDMAKVPQVGVEDSHVVLL